MFATFLYCMSKSSARFFFILSGEHSTLPLAELKAVLQAYAVDYRIVGSFYKLIEVEADPAKLEKKSFTQKATFPASKKELSLLILNNSSLRRTHSACEC